MEPANDASGPDKVREGLRLFNDEFFFEAHEVLEEVWHAERGEPRLFLQGLIQLSAAYHHLQNGNFAGAAELLQRGGDKLRRYPPAYMGLDAGALVRRADADRERVLRMRMGPPSADPFEYPKVEWTSP